MAAPPPKRPTGSPGCAYARSDPVFSEKADRQPPAVLMQDPTPSSRRSPPPTRSPPRSARPPPNARRRGGEPRRTSPSPASVTSSTPSPPSAATASASGAPRPASISRPRRTRCRGAPSSCSTSTPTACSQNETAHAHSIPLPERDRLPQGEKLPSSKAIRDPRLSDGQGSHSRLGARIHRSRTPRAQGRQRQLALLCGLLGARVSNPVRPRS